MKAEILLDNRTSDPLDESFTQLITQVITETLALENVRAQTEISISIVCDEEMRPLNKKYRGIDKTTDVLSFPLCTKTNWAVETATLLPLGDIIISIDNMFAQATHYGHSPSRELGFLIAHGLLHLLGYDHTNAAEEQRMIEKQEHVLQKLNLGR
jgi:probable rRNA maturation factor